MRVKNHQKRAKVAFTKPFTTHLMPCKSDFSCRVDECSVTKIFYCHTSNNMIRLHLMGQAHECCATKIFYYHASNNMIELHVRWLTHECSVTKRFYCHASNNMIRPHLRGTPMSAL